MPLDWISFDNKNIDWDAMPNDVLLFYAPAYCTSGFIPGQKMRYAGTDVRCISDIENNYDITSYCTHYVKITKPK